MSQRFVFGWCVIGLLLAFGPGLQAGEPVDLAQVLHDWQHASQSLASAPPDDDLAADGGAHSAHELQAAAALCGPVSARDLVRQFEWTTTTTDDGATVLTAAPRDALSRLFFTAIEIEIDPRSHLPRQFRFRDPQQKLRPIAITAPAAEREGRANGTSGEIRLAALVQVADGEDVTDAPLTSEVLRAWAEATGKIDRAEIEFVRYEYDHVSGLEKRSAGRFHFESPDRGLYERSAAAIEPDAVSRRTQADGTPFKVEADSASLLCWDNMQVVVAYPEQQAYDQFPIPKSNPIQPAGSFTRAWYSLATPQSMLPATVDVHSEGFLQRFEWSLLDHDEGRLILQGRPVSDEDQLEVFELQVILDPATHLSQATRLIPADRNREVVHMIKRFAINDAAPAGNWRPDLSGYRKYELAPLAPPAEEE